VAQVMERVPIQDLCGVGAKMRQHLSKFGIKTCGELGRFPIDILKRNFGVTGERLHYMGLGIDTAPVIPDEEAEEVKSVGHSTTLERDITERQEILKYLLQLSEMVGRRARKYQVAGKTITLTVRYPDFTTFSKQESRTDFTNNSEEIYRASVKILDSIELTQAIRLLGVKVSNLRGHTEQLPLFPAERKKALLANAMDHVNNKFGDFAVTFGSILGQEGGSKVISPAWRPEGLRNVDVD
jgi:DNA polymerase IV